MDPRALRYVVALVVMLSSAPTPAAPIGEAVVVRSPDGSLAATFNVRDEKLYYSVARGERQIVAPSNLEILVGATVAIVGHSARESTESWSPVFGQFSTITDHHRELSLSLDVNNTPMTLVCRVFNSGVGIRFIGSEESRDKELRFVSEYRLLEGVAHFAGERGRSVDWFAHPASNESQAQLGRAVANGVPLVSVGADGLHTGYLESDLYSAEGFELMRLRPNRSGGSVSAFSSAVSRGEGHVTPWRVLLVGDSAGDLVMNTVALNLAAPCKMEDTRWIAPGKSLWDWRIHGYDNGSFNYGIDTRSYLHMINFCAEYGIEYLTIDDFWFISAGGGEMVVSPDVDIERVMNHAKENGVRIILYYDRRKGDFGDDKLFGYYAGLDAAAIKYGFMGNNAAFTRKSIDASAEVKLLVNFHDGPTPMVGVERTMPNLITREFCHAQQDSRRAFTPESFLRMAMVSSLTGPLDMSNGNFDILGINAGERQKGPRQRHSYISTVVSELARTLVVYSGIITLPDAPEEYLKKPDLFEFLRLMPTTWDESLAPNSTIGEYLTVARRSGEAWFVGSVNDQAARTLPVKLDFLEPNRVYVATVYEDAEDTHGVENPEAYTVRTTTVKQGDILAAKMAVGGGHAILLRPLDRKGQEH